jgi:hypothetical protein
MGQACQETDSPDGLCNVNDLYNKQKNHSLPERIGLIKHKWYIKEKQNPAS